MKSMVYSLISLLQFIVNAFVTTVTILGSKEIFYNGIDYSDWCLHVFDDLTRAWFASFLLHGSTLFFVFFVEIKFSSRINVNGRICIWKHVSCCGQTLFFLCWN